jgi:hypothetical protein
MKRPSAIDFFRNFGSLFPGYFNLKEFFGQFAELILFGRRVAMIRAIDMKTITMVYPGFQMLPKGLKQLLVESESFFFEEETTFFRRDRKPFGSPSVNNDFVVRQRLSKSWKN